MKYLKKFKLFEKQLKLFPNIKDYDDYKKTADIIVNKFKGDKVQPDTTKTIQNAIDEYANFNKLYKKYMEYDQNEDEYNEILSKYLDENLHIIPEMMLLEKSDSYNNFYEQLKEYKPDFDFESDDVNNDDFIQHVTDYIISLNFSSWELIYELDINSLIETYGLINYIENKYLNEIDFEYYADMEYFDSLIYALKDNVDDNYVKIYRMIDVPEDEEDLIEHLKNYSGTGEYWSYEFDGAIAHCSAGGCNSQSITLIANVSAGNVDWEQTFFKSVYALKEEREIQVQQNVTINLEGIVLNALENELYNIKQKEIEHIEKAFNLGWSKKHELEHELSNETNDKATIIFENPIILKV